MNALAAFPSLAPALPEIILSIGAMVLLMFGAFNGENSPQVWTCGMTFGDGTEASLIVNSPLKDGKDACDVLFAGYQAAK